MIQPLASLSQDTQTERDVAQRRSLRGFVRRGRATILDQKGVELADLKEVAAIEAVRRAVELEGGEVAKGVPASPGTILVDDGIRTVLEVPLEGTLRHLRNRPRAGPLR